MRGISVWEGKRRERKGNAQADTLLYRAGRKKKRKKEKSERNRSSSLQANSSRGKGGREGNEGKKGHPRNLAGLIVLR